MVFTFFPPFSLVLCVLIPVLRCNVFDSCQTLTNVQFSLEFVPMENVEILSVASFVIVVLDLIWMKLGRTAQVG